MRERGVIVGSLVASLVVASAGCGGAEAPPGLDEYFAAVPYAKAACNVVDQRLAGAREVHLFVHGDADLLPVTHGLASYYHRHSLTFNTPAQPEQTPQSYALDTDQNGLMQAVVAAFPNVNFDDEAALMADPVLWPQLQTFIGSYIFRPMIDFATAHAAGQDVTNFVLLPSIERPGGESISAPGSTTVGLSVSPALLAAFAREMAADGEVWQFVDLPSGFTPIEVLGADALDTIAQTDPEIRDLTTAHEFGHSAGLVHSEVDRNLMYPTAVRGKNDCTDSLNDDQLDIMRTTLGLATAAAPLVADGAAATATQLARFRSSFTPAHARALLAGDRQAMRAFVALFRADARD